MSNQLIFSPYLSVIHCYVATFVATTIEITTTIEIIISIAVENKFQT